MHKKKVFSKRGQERLMIFILTKNKRPANVVSDSTLQLIFKKFSVVSSQCSIKEHPQLLERAIQHSSSSKYNYVGGRFSSNTSIKHAANRLNSEAVIRIQLSTILFGQMLK